MLRLTSFEQLNEVCARLHDCPFDLDDAVFNRSTSMWHGTFLCPAWDDPAAEHRDFLFLVSQSRLPVFEESFGVRHVSDVCVLHDQGIGTYTLELVEQTSYGVRFVFNDRMSIKLFLDGSIEPYYEERGKPTLRARYRQWLILLETGPRIEQVG